MARFFGRLIFLSPLVFCVLALLPSVSFASASHQTSAEADATCEGGVAWWNANGSGTPNAHCVDVPVAGAQPGQVGGQWQQFVYGSVNVSYTYYLPTGSDCLNVAPFYVDNSDGSKTCIGGCEFSPQGGNEKWWVRTGSGVTYHQSKVQYAPDGATCSASSSPPPLTASTGPVPPLCGGGSCFDPNSGSYCASDASGAQFCVPAPAPGSGACASSGSSTLCAGNNVPPPVPPNPPIGDPATDIGASDNYGSQSGGGTINNTTVNNFSGGGTGAVNNGAQPGSVGAPASTSSAAGASPGTGVNPAPSSSSGGNKGTASGGGDCNTPPICSGDAPTCAVLAQVWDARCKGDGVSSNDSDTTVPGLDGIPASAASVFAPSETVLDKLDGTGFGGGGQCPRMPAIKIPMFNVDYESDWPEWCNILGVAGNVILLLAAYTALRIISE